MYYKETLTVLIALTLWSCITESFRTFFEESDNYHHEIPHEEKSFARNMPGDLAENRITPSRERDTQYWLDYAQHIVRQRAGGYFKNKRAKNIILFLGDGMSISTLTAARILKGQREGRPGEESSLAMEQFPFAGLSKTYCTNGQTADSACSATAYLTGVKTNLLTIGVNGHVIFNNCTSSSNPAYHVESIAKWAQDAGKATGIVTTTTVTHASPSASYAHVANRNWESDYDILKTKAVTNGPCSDIAKQLIQNEPGNKFDVIMGGGFKKFIPNDIRDAFGVKGERRDSLNLVEEWLRYNSQGKLVTTIEELQDLDFVETQKLLGLFHSSHLEYHAKASTSHPAQPRLKDMTEAALKILQKNPQGYFAFIEGGRIDHGHHSNIAGYALDETLEFDEAIQMAINMTNEEETLIVVTSDHSHTMTISGYPGRGNPILGLNQYNRDLEGIPYSVLNYALGPQQYVDKNGKRLDLSSEKYDEFMVKPSYIHTKMGAHAGEDVALFARGPQAHLFSGTMEQNVIPHLMAYAACIGHGPTFCDE
ncbi:alkaline phosphatase [Stomoxys calcitrans]|uniref:alkaline phosphatase n=1 Tax=Stomoxys calcitrans TaxID=35570 RepID=UPI0027E2EA5E|nr:alkaline phosphatase [Stomoxys calcitrans]